jgi:hypothetical protein
MSVGVFVLVAHEILSTAGMRKTIIPRCVIVIFVILDSQIGENPAFAMTSDPEFSVDL